MNPLDKAINVAKFQRPAGTLGEYLQHKADSVRNSAYERSINRNKGVEIVYPLDNNRREYNERIIQGYLSGTKQPDSVKRRQQANYDQAVKELNNNCEYGLNCIASATSNYPRDSYSEVNDDFEANHEKYGFKGIMLNEALPGDIIQTVNERGPYHGMIFSRWDENEKPRFNYSSGGIEEGHYVKNGLFNSKGYYAWRYVGTPALIEKWTKEYNNKNPQQ